MNQGQQMFYDYVMGIVQDGKSDELKAMLIENFKRQDDGTMTPEYMKENGPKLIALLKSEHQADFTSKMAHFMGTLKP